MAASFETLHLQPPIPPTPEPSNSIPIPILIPILIPLSVLTEILLRLPAKSLIQFKSVCKEWLSLISSDYLCHQHTLCRRPKKPQPSLILQYSRFWRDRRQDYFYWKPTLSMNGGEKMMIPYTLSVSRDYKILQACNGLLLLREGEGSSYFRSYKYCVYNPTTRLSTEINIPTSNEKGRHIVKMALAFDPSKSPYYKIVCTIRPSKLDDHAFGIEVYDSESRSWKLILGQFTLPSGFDCYEAQYYNNAIYYWYSCNNDSLYYCFDIAKNEMKTLSCPRSHITMCDSYFQELDGRLYNVTLSFDAVNDLLVAVWELVVRGDGNWEWLLKHDGVFVSEGIGYCLGLIMGGAGNLVSLIYHHDYGKMRAYSFPHKSCVYVVDFTAPPFHYKYDYELYRLKVFQFVETLALV